MTMPLSQYGTASMGAPVTSAFSRNICHTLKIAGAMPVDDPSWSAVEILRRPHGEIYQCFAQSGDKWLNIAGRFHQLITAGLRVADIPPGLHAFFQETFFSDFVASARFELYFKTLSDVLAEDLYDHSSDPQDQPLDKPESETRAIGENRDFNDSMTWRPQDLAVQRVEVGSSGNPRR